MVSRREFNLPAVGKNLQDHVSVILMYRRQNPSPFLLNMRADRIGFDFIKTYLTGRGVSGDVPAVSSRFSGAGRATLAGRATAVHGGAAGCVAISEAIQGTVCRRFRDAGSGYTAGKPR
jgi:hypothetical protein